MTPHSYPLAETNVAPEAVHPSSPPAEETESGQFSSGNLAAKLAILQQIDRAARQVMGNGSGRRSLGPDALARLRQTLIGQRIFAQMLGLRVAGTEDGQSHQAEIIRICQSLQDAEREIALQLKQV